MSPEAPTRPGEPIRRHGPAPLATLSVDRSDGGLRLRLDVPGDGRDGPLQEEVFVRIDATTLEALFDGADTVLQGGGHAGWLEEARVRGGVLHRTLVPPVLQERLRAVTGALLVTTPLHGIPWELLHDGEAFWGVRYALGRRVVTARAITYVAAVSLPARPRALVVGADPTADLPFVSRELEAVCRPLSAHADLVCVGGRLATFDAVTGHLSDGFDLVHFAGHTVVTADGESALLLADGRRLDASVIERVLRGRPLVVLNACGTARGTMAPARDRERRMAGLAHAFLFGGAAGVVATFTEVSDRHAAFLATHLYRDVLAGVSVGEALRRARVGCQADATVASSPIWLSVGLYGMPTLRLGGLGTSVRVAAATDTVTANRHPSRRTVLAATAAMALVAGTGLWRWRSAPGARSGRALVVKVGVMESPAVAGDAPPWMRALSRARVNAVLARMPGVQVFSQEKIDFLCESRRLCGIAGAEALGLTKMIALAVSLSGEHIAIDVRIVDVASDGVLEFTDRVQGRPDRLIALQNDAIVRLLGALGLPLSPEESARLREERSDDLLESYRLLADTLGGMAPMPPPQYVPPAPSSRLGKVAHAAELEPGEAAVRDVIQAYETALSSGRVEDVAALQLDMSDTQRNALERYFANVRDLTVRFSQLDVLVYGSEAIATYLREDAFTDVRSGRSTRLRVHITNRLVERDGRWRILIAE